MPGPYTTALRNAKRESESEDLFNLAFVDVNGIPIGDDGVTAEQRDQILGGYIGRPWEHIACHNVADLLLDVLGTGATTVTQDALGRAAAIAAVNLGNRLIRLHYTGHSVVLIAGNGTLESLEGWAGAQPGSAGVIVLPIADCIGARADEIDIDPNACAIALANILNADDNTRETAWNTFSRAGLVGFEGDPVGIKPLTVHVRATRPLAEARQEMRARMDGAKQWISRVKAVAGRSFCWECFAVHGAWTSRVRKWHLCRICGKTYCGGCGRGFDRPLGSNWTSERRCPATGCPGRTQLITM